MREYACIAFGLGLLLLAMMIIGWHNEEGDD